jgi:hypothetical protein
MKTPRLRSVRAATTVFLFLACANASASIRSEAIVQPVRAERPPRLDGVFDDAIWSRIEPITEFFQWDPDPGEPISERTELRIAYDQRNLYFAFRCHDRNPNKIVSDLFERDSQLWNDDSVVIAIDSNNDNRTAFEFRTNLNCARGDRQLVEGGKANPSYDPVWSCAARRDENGFSIEIQIPFYALRFKPTEEVEMGLIVGRDIPRRKEYSHWPVLPRNYTLHNVSQYGRMVGLRGIERGVDMEIKPGLIVGRTETPEMNELDSDVSLDVKWGVTPSLTSDFTLNTDFAQVENDSLEVNLTRFSLLYPEKREFFLESPDLFQFGPQQAQAFFSRRIGIRDGREVPLLGGARLYGLAGDTNIGVLAMRTRTVDGIDGENFVVTRVKQNLLDRSYIGGIFTSRTGVEGEEDRTFGLDASYVFGTNSTLFASIAKNEGRPSVESGEWFYHAFASYDTDLLSGRVAYMDIGQNYEPGIGFVPRPDQKNLSLSGSFNPRPSWELVRQMELALDYERIETHEKVVETQKGRFAMTANFDTGDRLWFSSEVNNELIPAPFEIAPDVFVPGGSYGFRQFEIGGSLYEARRLTGSLSFRWGGLYGGHLSAANASLTWKRCFRHPVLLRRQRHLNASCRPARAGVPITSYSIKIDKDVGMHTKTSLSVIRRVASPACMVGVRISSPNFRARCGQTKL